MRNLFHSYIAGLFVFIFSLSAWADMYKHVEVIVSRLGNRDVYVTDQSDNKIRVGTIVTWKKGKTLFHWGRGSAEQAARWDAEGKVSVDLLNWLKANQSGFIGSGFYVSDNPVDSHTYGNVLVAVELPKDIELIRADSYGPNGQSAAWNEIIDKVGVAGTIHFNTDRWANIRDAEALTKEYVMTPERIEKLKPNGALGVTALRGFAGSHPEFRETNWYKREVALAQRSEKNMQEVNSKALAATRKYLNKSTFDSGNAITFSGVPANAPIEVIYKALHGNNFWQSSRHMFSRDNSNFMRAIEMGLYAETDRGVYSVLAALTDPGIPAEVRTGLLQDALDYWHNDPPKPIADRIEDLKSRGAWKPAPSCSSAFSP